MNSRWQAVPDTAPFRCPITQQSERADGPYLRTGIVFYAVVLDQAGRPGPGRREEALYLSPQAIREMCELQGSPLVAVSRDVWEALQRRIHSLETEVADAGEALVELERYRQYATSPVDTEALLATLDQRYAKKTGPKKAPA